MPSVDDRIVRLEFDNAAFERKISSSLTSLEKLNKALELSGAQTGLSNISDQAGKMNFQSISDGIEGVSKKFLALSTIAITALANITGKVIDLGAQMVKSLALDNIMGGFKEYELKMGSIQTIMAGSGASLETVNQKLAELNDYSDRTIYSFKDMTSNIGKFTNAGVDLDTAVGSIQGVANVAAVSGANAEEASRAMYNFAQALSKGYVQLVDWKSIELANMGTAEFKQQLLDAGVAAGTLTKKGDEYITMEGTATTATKGFNESLTDQWLTTDVLNKTLGDYADETTDIGKKAFAAAQDIKTFSQLLDTTKESIGSGWAQSFEILIGNFDEAKQLFGGLGAAISGFVGRQADARNSLLQGWKDMGGRDLLIYSITAAFQRLMMIMKPIKEAFREIFPAMTADRLYALTVRLSELANALEPSAETVDNLKRIFKGFFSVLKIGWEIVKRGAQFIGDLFTSITGAGGGQFLAFIANIGDFFTGLGEALVTGGGITKFFDGLTEVLKKPIPFLEKVKELIGNLFGGFDEETSEKIGNSFQRVSDRFGPLKDFFEKVGDLWKPFKKLLDKVMEIVDKIWEAIKDFGSELGNKLYEALSSSNFDAALDVLNTAIFGGIALAVSKFLKNGLSFNLNAQFESGGIFGKVTKTLEQVTGVLSAMQANLKANTLMKIAGAIALLTASVLTLSLIDSDALTKALTAMSIGFGQLMGAFAIISKMSVGPSGAVSMTLIGASMITLAGAIALLALSAKTLADLDWDELARGLVGVTVLLGIVVAAVLPLSKMQGSFIRTGIGLIAVAIAIRILANAVEKMASMSWGDLVKGFIGVAAGLVLIGVAMKLMPANMALQGLGILMVATSLAILAGVVKVFSMMSWGDMAKGFAAVAAGLVLIGLAMKLMPLSMPITAAGLILVGIALEHIAKALIQMGGMSWGEIGRGLVAMAGSLIVLAAAAHLMSGAIAGAIAIGIMSVSLGLLVKVLKEFANIEFSDLIHGLIAMAAALAVIGVAAMLLQPALGPMLLLGAALTLIGIGFALFGLGAMLVAEAFERLAVSGAKGSAAMVEALKNIGKAIPALMTGFAEGIIGMLDVLLDAAPEIASKLGELLGVLLDELAKLIPKAAKLVGTLISELIKLIREKVPEYVLLGVEIILAFLQGIRDNVGEIVTVVGEIITEFVDAFSEQLTGIIQSVTDLITTFFTDVAEAVGQVAGTLMGGVGEAFMQGFLDGLGLDSDQIMQWVEDFITGIIDSVMELLGIKSPSTVFNDIGVDLIVGFFNGIKEAAKSVARWFQKIGSDIVKWVGNVTRTLWQKGYDFISGILTGITDRIGAVSSYLGGIVRSAAGWVGNTLGALWQKGVDLLQGFWNGIKSLWESISLYFQGLAGRVKMVIGGVLTTLLSVGRDIFQGLWNGLKEKWESIKSWVSAKIDELKHAVTHPWDLLSPSKFTYHVGEMIVAGLANAIRDDTTMNRNMNAFVETAKSTFENSVASITASLGNMSEFNPTITPVLDLTSVETEAKKIADYIQASQVLVPAVSTANANVIASAGSTFEEDSPVKAPAGSGEVKFEQNIYAPKQLSTEDIYRQTRNQITMAKQELSIP